MNNKDLAKYIGGIYELELEKYRLTEIKEKLEIEFDDCNDKMKRKFESKKDNDVDKFFAVRLEKINARIEWNKARKIRNISLVWAILSFIPIAYLAVEYEAIILGYIIPIASMIFMGVMFNKVEPNKYKIFKELDKTEELYKEKLVKLLVGNEKLIDIVKYSERSENFVRNDKNELYSTLNRIIDKKENTNLKMFKSDQKVIKENYDNLEDELDLANKNIEITEKKLDEFYDKDVIFEKYRNLPAISMFYEYLRSSRVEKLEGSDGAYNLYESELRQNIIIGNLEKINENLDRIKENQFVLYKGMRDINESLNIIDDDINNNTKVVKEISKNLNTIKNMKIMDYYISNDYK